MTGTSNSAHLCGAGSWSWQRHGRRSWARLFGLFAYIPMAHAMPSSALGEVNVNMVFVVAVRSRPQHRHETRAGTQANTLAKLLVQAQIGEPNDPSIGKCQRANVERIRFPMFG